MYSGLPTATATAISATPSSRSQRDDRGCRYSSTHSQTRPARATIPRALTPRLLPALVSTAAMSRHPLIRENWRNVQRTRSTNGPGSRKTDAGARSDLRLMDCASTFPPPKLGMTTPSAEIGPPSSGGCRVAATPVSAGPIASRPAPGGHLHEAALAEEHTGVADLPGEAGEGEGVGEHGAEERHCLGAPVGAVEAHAGRAEDERTQTVVENLARGARRRRGRPVQDVG